MSNEANQEQVLTEKTGKKNFVGSDRYSRIINRGSSRYYRV